MSARTRFRRLLDEAPHDAPAIEVDGDWTTWGSLRSIADQLETSLQERSLGAGVRVGVVLESRPEHVAVVLALISTGRCVVTLSPLQPPTRLAADVVAADLPVLVASPEMLAKAGVREALGRGVPLALTAFGVSDEGGP
ncbi:hypothetical protein BH11ACT8_BH11ACT8_06110 [soil metagenome]